ncbi:MAG: DNA polymerase III subunit gamma/tau [Pseudomonadota bacterium]|nr:DNA polymerase III subunit gamma/tau [Pseudomonadota bacterium]
MTDTKNYIVLARKYRPKKLSDIVGQEDVCKIIEGSVRLNRIAHAFLFSGTRGIGKTTLARILAKIVNCTNLNMQLVEPCAKCINCTSIDKGNNIDVVEIDAASRTGVSDVREIIDNVNYKPVGAKKKIFIIDEIHMLSKAAFNALLKTLEEPPLDVIFIFATTETEKMPLTILSRCQRFQLKRVDLNIISKLLMEISKKENFKIDEEGCNLISQASEGSVRDALSILDNVLTRGNPVKIEIIKNVLGLSDNRLVLDLFDSLCIGDVRKSLQIFDDLYERGASIEVLCQTLMKLAYHTTRIKLDVDINNSFLDSKTQDKINVIAEKFQIDFLIRFWELMQKYMNEVNKCFDQKQCFEMIIMRLCYVSLMPTPFELLKKVDGEKQDISQIKDEISRKKNSQEKDHDNERISNKNTKSNLAPRNEEKKLEENRVNAEDNNLFRFKSLVDSIEEQSEVLITYHLKNSFRLVSVIENQKVREIELENISDNQDCKKILWKASKLLSNITKNRWIISLSSKKGMKSLAEFELDLEKEKINEIKKNKYVKKILEIIPSSEVISIKELGVLKKLNKKEDQ